MAISELSFSRVWTDQSRFPATTYNEAPAWVVIQALHDETKDYINDNIVPTLNQTTATANAAVSATEKGAANGVASLGADGKILISQLPTYDGTVE